MEMHKQYLAQVKFAFDAKSLPDNWWNAVRLASGGRKMYAKTLEEAETAIKAIKASHQSDPDQQVTESRIRVREVTDWEEV